MVTIGGIVRGGAPDVQRPRQGVSAAISGVRTDDENGLYAAAASVGGVVTFDLNLICTFGFPALDRSSDCLISLRHHLREDEE